MTQRIDELEAIRATAMATIESNDRRITPDQRLRAAEMLRELGGQEGSQAIALTAHILSLSDEALVAELYSMFPTPPALFEERVQAEVERRAADGSR